MGICNHIETQASPAKDAQARAVCRWMHQIVGNSLHTLESQNLPAGVQQAVQLVSATIAQAMFTHHAFYNETLSSMPGAVVPSSKMIFDISITAKMISIKIKTLTVN